MNSEWKRFLLQWILPVGVFGIVLIFMISSFNANIKEKVAEDYKTELVKATDSYASNFVSSCQNVESMTKAAADIIVSQELKGNDTVSSLEAIVDHSEAYLAYLADGSGKAITNLGEIFDFTAVTYYSEVFSDSSTPYHFVENDGIMANPALIVSTEVQYPEETKKIFSYYPMNVSSLKKVVTPENDYDSRAFSILANSSGLIMTSTNTDPAYSLGQDAWEVFTSKGGNVSHIRKGRTRVNAGNSGYFELNLDGRDYLVCFTPATSTNCVLLVCFTKDAIDQVVEETFASIGTKMIWIGVIIGAFLLVITILNIVQIYVASRNTEDLKDKADTDQLTGLKNKVATEREIKEYIEEHPDTLAMMFLIDIDNFKKINDTMGHAFGDEVLRELGRHIGINFRVSDVIGRTGGDEFTVFLKNLKEDANTIREAQKLVYFFRHFQVGDYVKYTVTASIGAAVFPTHGADFETLYKAADQAVYKSKKRGKNQLSFYDDRDRTPEEVAEADAHLIDIERKEETPIES